MQRIALRHGDHDRPAGGQDLVANPGERLAVGDVFENVAAEDALRAHGLQLRLDGNVVDVACDVDVRAWLEVVADSNAALSEWAQNVAFDVGVRLVKCLRGGAPVRSTARARPGAAQTTKHRDRLLLPVATPPPPNLIRRS